MDLFRRYGNLLRDDGTNQLQRSLPALEQGYILPDERSLSDLIEYARRLATEIRFYSVSGQATGDWRAFFEPLVDPATGRARSLADVKAAMQTARDWPPHVALFLVFLELFRNLQDDINELPERHLRHYYQQELRLLRRRAVRDEVHVIFELADNAAPTLLPAGTDLDAGTDREGRRLRYATDSELVVSAATVRDIHRLVVETDRRGKRRFFASDARSESEGESWYTFGRSQLPLDASERFMAEAHMGFAIASPLLRMAEGKRKVTLTADLHCPSGDYPPPQGIGVGLDIALTGSEGWVVPDSFSAHLADSSTSGATTLVIDLTLAETAPAIVPFDAELHGDGPRSDAPVLRCLVRGQSGYYETLDELIVKSAILAVAVTGVRNLVVQNDEAPLTPDQPMPAFGSQPRIGSHFYIGSAEVFGKKLSTLALNLAWQSPPADFYQHY